MQTRPVKEIQRAHDLLLPVVTKEIDADVSAENMVPLHAMLDVLCWVLCHDHNPAFATNLERLEKYLAERGLVLEDQGN